MQPPRLVLVRPRNADNLVSIALAMRTFGLTEWVAVSSALHLEGMLEVLARHRTPMEAAQPVLSTLRRVETVPEALEGCSWSVGTTMRTLGGRSRWSSRELGHEAARRNDACWALMFGAETNGLQNDDLAHCDALSFIPSHEAQPSLNLSQSVVVYAHELWPHRASGTG